MPFDKWRPVVLRWISRRTIRSFFYLFYMDSQPHVKLIQICYLTYEIQTLFIIRSQEAEVMFGNLADTLFSISLVERVDKDVQWATKMLPLERGAGCAHPAFVGMRLTDALVKIIYLLSCLLSTGARNHLASVPEKPWRPLWRRCSVWAGAISYPGRLGGPFQTCQPETCHLAGRHRRIYLRQTRQTATALNMQPVINTSTLLPLSSISVI